MTFVDEYSRPTYVYSLRNKDEEEYMFMKYNDEVENRLDRKIERRR